MHVPSDTITAANRFRLEQLPSSEQLPGDLQPFFTLENLAAGDSPLCQGILTYSSRSSLMEYVVDSSSLLYTISRLPVKPGLLSLSNFDAQCFGKT